MMSLYVDIEKKLGSFRLSARFEAKEGVMALLGASGCGKSMTLKCIAGIEKPDRGRIILGGATLFDSEKRIDLTPQKRRVGYLFQQYALFPNMTVWQNIKAGVRDRRDAAAVSGMIKAMRLEGLEHKRPHQLSGGQQQRVALARILVNEPSALLLDEPFSALDSYLRFQMEQEVREVIRRFSGPVVLVSHNRDEVFRLSGDIAIMRDGTIETQGDRKSVFADPATKSGAVMTGCKNISRIERLGGSRVLAVDWDMELKLDREPVDDIGYIGIRMHDVALGEGENSFLCRVVEEIENPFSYAIMLRPVDADDAVPVGWETDKSIWRAARGETVRVALPKKSLLLLRE
jgi:molybdate transport system ATP-binding protein